MADCVSLAGADLLVEITNLRRQLIDSHMDKLRECGHARDIELLFFNGDHCRPDWDLADSFGTAAGKIVREIFDLSHEVAHAERELELRALPN